MSPELREALITHAADALREHVMATQLKMPWNDYSRTVVDALLAYTIPCPTCGGVGRVVSGANMISGKPSELLYAACGVCSGSGRVPALTETQP